MRIEVFGLGFYIKAFNQDTVESAAPVNGSSPSAVLQAADNADKKDIEKHACKGLNSCKGNGGGSKKEFGKNSCKGKGACATDGSKPPAK